MPHRVLRCGSWFSYPWNLRSGYRYGYYGYGTGRVHVAKFVIFDHLVPDKRPNASGRSCATIQYLRISFGRTTTSDLATPLGVPLQVKSNGKLTIAVCLRSSGIVSLEQSQERIDDAARLADAAAIPDPEPKEVSDGLAVCPGLPKILAQESTPPVGAESLAGIPALPRARRVSNRRRAFGGRSLTTAIRGATRRGSASKPRQTTLHRRMHPHAIAAVGWGAARQRPRQPISRSEECKDSSSLVAGSAKAHRKGEAGELSIR
jgi:hypothetical protein